MMLEDRFFDQEWIQELSNEDFRMLLYLLHFASKKTGIVELNMRVINFAANTGKNYTKSDVLKRFGNMISMIPGKENTAIFPDYIATNWAKNGKPIDTVKNPLFKSVVQELASHSMTIADVNALAKKQIIVKGEEYDNNNSCGSDMDILSPKGGVKKSGLPETSVTQKDVEEMFEAFWSAWPKSCPRKTDKKKCRDKFAGILKRSKDAVSTFNQIMNGLEQWKICDMWLKDNGQFIRAPLVWLNNENWNDAPKKGAGNGTSSRGSGTANANYKGAGGEGIF